MLVVVCVALFFFCASQQGGLSAFPQLNLPQEVLNVLWIVDLSFLIAAFVVALGTKPPRKPSERFVERKAIKGLRPFTEADKEIFKKLQREYSLQECLAEITRPSFHFGILYGETGCGKTSFLQARLLTQLSHPESNLEGIYIRFSEQDPIDTIRQAFVEKLFLLPEDVSQMDFLTLLAKGVEAASKPLVLFFDQFEQFFLHFRRKKDRQFFIQALADWYGSADSLRVKVFVSIRRDFYSYLMEFQKAFGNNYSPSPQEAIEVEKFSSEEATNILEVLADTEGLEFDRHFIQEVAEQQLASRKDGLISPVDLQILAWMINGQKTSQLRVFNNMKYKKE